jgi:hypothetical protein
MTHTALETSQGSVEGGIAGISEAELSAMEQAAASFLVAHSRGGDLEAVTAPFGALTGPAHADAAGLVSPTRDQYIWSQDIHWCV